MMLQVLPLLGLLTSCASSRQLAYAPEEKTTDVPDGLRAAFAGAGQPNFSAATELQLWGSDWIRVGASRIDSADQGMAIVSVHYTGALQDEKSGRLEPTRCGHRQVTNWTNSEVMLGGGLFWAGELDSFPCSAKRRRTSEVESLAGRLFPLAVGNRLSFEIRGKHAYRNKDSGWPHGRRYTYEVIGKQDGYQNGYMSIPGDVYRIRITMQNLHNGGASTGTVLWSDALKWVVRRGSAQWDPTIGNAWSTELAAVAGVQPSRDASGREMIVVPLSAKTSYTPDELWQVAIDALTGEPLKRERAALRDEEEARARLAKGKTHNSQQESAARFLGFASALAGGMMAAEGARTGNTAMLNQGSDVMVRGGVVAATGDREDLGDLSQSLTRAAGGPSASAATGGIAPHADAAGAQQIVSACNSRCSGPTTQCRKQTQGRNQEPCYRAAACQCQCFLEHAPDSPNAGQWRQCVADNSANAERLRSNATVFDPNRR